MVGDVLRRLVGRTMAKQVTKEVEGAISPFQYALSTRSGCECVAHVLQTLTELDEDATIVSVDGIGAYDGRQCSMDCSQLNGESNFSLSSGVSTVHHNIFMGR